MSRKDRRAHLQAGYKPPTPPPVAQIPPVETIDDDGIPTVTDLEMTFGGVAMKVLPPYHTLSKEDLDWNDPFNKAASGIFFQGGRLSDYGLYPKPGKSQKKIVRITQSILGDFAPKHEHKIGGMANLLRQWCTYHG